RLPLDDSSRADVLLDRCESLLAIGDVAIGTQALNDLVANAADDRLRAWADCFGAELAILTGGERLSEIEQRAAAAATTLLALGDGAGTAKANAVRARALLRLGHFGESEIALDNALDASRRVSDRRRT